MKQGLLAVSYRHVSAKLLGAAVPEITVLESIANQFASRESNVP